MKDTQNTPEAATVHVGYRIECVRIQYQIWYSYSMAWTVDTLNETVDQELAALPDDMQRRFVYITELIESFGLPFIGEPHVKHIQGALWEIRLKGRDGIARALYVTATGQRVVVLRVFVKKSRKTPNS